MICPLLLLTLFSINYTKVTGEETLSELTNNFITVTDTTGNVILQTGISVHIQDEFIDEQNHVYIITELQGTSAIAEYVREEALNSELMETISVQASFQQEQQLVGVYHTHTDESYIPSDGKSSKRGNGSILLVGEAFTRRLAELGYQTDHDKTLHDPHDANAYHRSRRTVMKLLQKQPTALFDLHRDSAPAQVYNYQIDGQPATKLLLVVGRQNQYKNTTLNFAKTIKAAADAKYKGLIRGIFIAKGGYNQDLAPRSILVEMGTQYNSREAAERSAALFADLVPNFLAASSAAPSPKAPVNQPSPTQEVVSEDDTDAGWSYDLLLITGSIILATGAFLFLSTGNLKEAKKKLRNFFKFEFGDIFQRKKK